MNPNMPVDKQNQDEVEPDIEECDHDYSTYRVDDAEWCSNCDELMN